MDETLADRFARSMGGPVELDSEPVHLSVEFVLLARSRLRFNLEARAEHAQALCVEVDGGTLEVVGKRSKGMVFWAETAPPSFEAHIVPGRSGRANVRLWNAWRGSHGAMHSGIGNGGIRAAWRGDDLVLTCSDGWGPVSFGDLVARIRVVEGNIEGTVAQ